MIRSPVEVSSYLSNPAISTATAFSNTMAATMTLVSPSHPPLPRAIGTVGKPKLSLNTRCSQGRIIGRSNTSLRPDAIAAVASPTIRNTYQNGYDSQAPFPISAAGAKQKAQYDTSPTSSAGSSETHSPMIPYTHASTAKSILKNSPLLQQASRRTTVNTSAGSQQRRFFPPSARVSFRTPLAEDIHNKHYQRTHLELLIEERGEAEVQRATRPDEGARLGDKRESPPPCDDGDDGVESNGHAKTPVAGRRKKHRDWKWTIGDDDERDGSRSSPQRLITETSGKKIDAR